MRMSKRRFVQNFASGLVIILFTMGLLLVVDFMRFPEYYMPTWRHSLECEINRGEADAIYYYERVYVSNGKYLFGEGE